MTITDVRVRKITKEGKMRAVYTADFRENIKHYLCLFVVFF